MSLQFTGEFMISGQSPKRFEEDHLARYQFAWQYGKDKRVLDIVGGGWRSCGSKLLRGSDTKVVYGVDISQNVIDSATEDNQIDGVHYSVGDGTIFSSPVPFDLIVCFEIIGHVRNNKAALANMSLFLTREEY